MVENQPTKGLFQYAEDNLQEQTYQERQEKIGEESESFAKTVAKRFFKNKLAVISLVVFILIVLMALFASQISPFPRDQTVGQFQAAPYGEHILGTDSVGRDVLTRLIHGAQVSLIVGFGSVAIYVVIGTTLGLMAGYFGGIIDSIIMRITEAFQSFPYFLVVLTFVSILNSGLWTVTLIMGILGWPRLARIVRGEVLRLKSQDFVLAAVATGYSTPAILFKHILPNLLSPILVNATFGVANNILTESSLSFLGVGVEPPRPSWGNILAEAQSLNVLTTQPWRWIPAGLLIFLTVLCVNFIGEGLREAIEGETKN
ncbi:MAG TPA: oligopeptide ABC transporter permease [Atopostipes sp.]|nr:oligopeptide ABC transporter permease [Atopostipes sp.]